MNNHDYQRVLVPITDLPCSALFSATKTTVPKSESRWSKFANLEHLRALYGCVRYKQWDIGRCIPHFRHIFQSYQITHSRHALCCSCGMWKRMPQWNPSWSRSTTSLWPTKLLATCCQQYPTRRLGSTTHVQYMLQCVAACCWSNLNWIWCNLIQKRTYSLL